MHKIKHLEFYSRNFGEKIIYYDYKLYYSNLTASKFIFDYKIIADDGKLNTLQCFLGENNKFPGMDGNLLKFYEKFASQRMKQTKNKNRANLFKKIFFNFRFQILCFRTF